MMLHKIYKKEKERIGKGYIWFIVGAFLWSFAMTHIFCQIAKEDASYVEFYHNILFAIGIIWYLNSKLGQFTRNYTQTTKRAADNK